MSDPAGPGLVEHIVAKVFIGDIDDGTPKLVASVLAEFLAALREPAMVEKIAQAMYERDHLLTWDKTPEQEKQDWRALAFVSVNVIAREVGGESGVVSS